MQTALHTVVGVVDVSSSPASAWWHNGGRDTETVTDSRIESAAPARRERSARIATVETVDADVQQLAVDLIIELERFHRRSAQGRRSQLAPR